MKLSAVFLAAAALAGTSSAYKISVYSGDNYQGTQKSWTTAGSHSVGYTVKSWIWTSAAGDGCCIAFCKGSSVSLIDTFLGTKGTGANQCTWQTSDGIAAPPARPSPALVSPRSLPGAARPCSTAKQLAKVCLLAQDCEGDGMDSRGGPGQNKVRKQLLCGLVTSYLGTHSMGN